MNIYTSSSGCFSPEQLTVFSGRIAAYFQRRGIRYAAVVCGKSPLVYAAVQACRLAGVCFIPVDEALPEQRRNRILNDADEIFYDGSAFTGGSGWTDLRVISEQRGAPTIPPEYPDAPVYRIYTSGTTGDPKCIEVTWRNLRSFMTWFRGIPAIAETNPRSVLNQANFSFDLSVADMWYSLLTEARLTVLERSVISDLPEMFRIMKQSDAELAVFTPSFAELCLCDSAFCRELMPRLRVIFFCGEILKPMTAAKLFRRFPKIRIINAYGPTEACCSVSAAEISVEMTEVPELPIGDIRRTAGTIHIVNGEIVITGDSVARCTNMPGGFGEYNGKRCFYTGDGGEIRDGMLWFCGRLDQQLKIKGYRVEPADIENNLLRIPGVTRAAVSASHGRLSAQVVTDGISADEIRRRLSELVPHYMIPGKITLMESLPLTLNGKKECHNADND